MLCLAHRLLLLVPLHAWRLAALIGVRALGTILLDRPEDTVTTGITTAVVMVVAAISRHHAWQQPILSLMGRHAVVIGPTKRMGTVGRDVSHRRRADTELHEAQRAVEASRDALARLVEEQAALRRVATLVARGAPPEELFTAVVEEIERVLPGAYAGLARFAPDGTMTMVAISESLADRFPVGSQWPLGGKNVSTMVFETGRSARIDNYGGASGRIGDAVHEWGPASLVGVPIVVEGRRWGSVTMASTEHPLPPDSEAQLASFTELVATAIANAEGQSELAASRARIVAAADEERRRVVRDLHDGAQQRLVHTIVTLKLARRALESRRDDAPALLNEALEHAKGATDELRELAHGILPDVLTRGGLSAGVRMLASRMPVPVEIAVSVGRLPAAVEATAYFLVSEALTNVAKHARAGHAEVTVRIEDGALAVHVRDDGIGGARADGSGLVGLADRLAALDGHLQVESLTDGGTLMTAAIPLAGSFPGLRNEPGTVTTVQDAPRPAKRVRSRSRLWRVCQSVTPGAVARASDTP